MLSCEYGCMTRKEKQGILKESSTSVMSLKILVVVTVVVLSGSANGRRRSKVREPTEEDTMEWCPKIRNHTPDHLHFMMTSDEGQNMAEFYKQDCNDSKKPSKSIKRIPQLLANITSNRIGFLDEMTDFQPVQEQDIADQCIKVGPCDHFAKYRTINGTCNNFRFPMWGCTSSALVRLVPAAYEDGNHKVRRSQSGKELPNARHLSASLFHDRNVPDKVNTYNVMQWGQLVAHDTTHIVQQDAGNEGVDCCHLGCAVHTDVCHSISIPPNDPFYSKYHQTCMNMVRSSTTTNLKCPLTPQQQVISVTHFIDASLVYGSTEKIARSLRTFKNGLLEVRADDKREFPPQSDRPRTDCDNIGDEKICYMTGDDRVNQNSGITLHQIVLLREHNRLARELKKLNPHWDDERLYQEARRILIAEVQRITYDEYLPIILGKEFLEKHDLIDGHGDEDFKNGYDEFLNPSTVNEFAAASFRAFHSMIPREVELCDQNFNVIKVLNIDDFYFRPYTIQKRGMFDKFLRGMAVQPSEAQDTYFSVAVTELLFKSTKPYGKDLESIDIQRGRDHGLATYNDCRRACGLGAVSNFQELVGIMSPEAVELLVSKYESPNDIDLFVGGMLELPLSKAMVGPTFACIIGEQFRRWKFGDRFYYEFGNQTGSFTHDQLVEIRKFTLAQLFCLNGDEIDRMPLDCFHIPDSMNPIKSCKNIRKMSLAPWKEEK